MVGNESYIHIVNFQYYVDTNGFTISKMQMLHINQKDDSVRSCCESQAARYCGMPQELQLVFNTQDDVVMAVFTPLQNIFMSG
jgi:hypothetical protein